MPSIDASINLTDNMSKVLNSIAKTMDSVIDKFDKLDKVSDKAINVNTIVDARQELDKVADSVDDIEKEVTQAKKAQETFTNEVIDSRREIDKVVDTVDNVGDEIVQAKKEQDNFTKSINSSSDASSKLLTAFKNIAVTVGGIYTVSKIIDTSTDITNVTARLNNANDGLQTTDELVNMVYASANRSYSSFMDTADAVAKLTTQTDGLFKSTKEALAFSELLNKSFAIGGTSAEGKSSVMLQLTQAMSSGVLRGEEFNALNENAGQLVQIIADYMGVAKGEMKDLASEGKITADIIKNAIFDAGEEIDATFNEMPNTFEDMKTKISNIALQTFTPLWKELEKFVNSTQVQKTIAGIALALGALGSVALGVMGIFSGIFNVVIDNWSLMGPIILTVAGAVMLYAMRSKLAIVYTTALGIAQGIQLIASKGVGASFVTNTVALGIYNTYTTIATVLTNVHSVAMALLTGATWSQVVAEYGLLAPLLLVIGLFLAVVGVIYLVVWAYNTLTGSTVSAMGIIVGVLSAVFAFIYNSVTIIWNFVLSFAEFFLNVFNDPVYAVKMLFANLAKAMINVMVATISPIDAVVTAIVKACVSGIDWVLGKVNTVVNAFGSVLSKIGINIPTLNLGLDYNGSSVASDLKNMSAGIDEWVGDRPEGYISLDNYRLDAKDLGEAFDWGYGVGEGIEDTIGGMFDLDSKMDEITNGIGDDMDYSQYIEDAKNAIDTGSGTGSGTDGYGSGNNSLGNIDDTTSKILGEVATNNEELKYLVDVAKKNQINGLTNVNISIPVNMTNNMGAGSDITGAIDYMTEQLTMKVSEAIETSANGVHN